MTVKIVYIPIILLPNNLWHYVSCRPDGHIFNQVRVFCRY